MSNQWMKVYCNGKWTSQRSKFGETVLLKMSISPELSQRWLEFNNKRNRKMKKNQINMIARDIERGQWLDNGSYISFYRDGQIHDGQNRLAAIAKSGCTVKTSVVFGILPEAIRVTDQQVKRTIVDTANLLGYECSGKSIRSAKYLLEVQQGSHNVYSDEILEFYSEHQSVLDQVTGSINSKYLSKQPVLSAIALICLQRPEEIDIVLEFAKKYNSGIGITNENSPVMKLRNFAQNNHLSNSGPWRKELFLKTLSACRAYVEGREDMSRLYPAKEDSIYLDEVRQASQV